MHNRVQNTRIKNYFIDILKLNPIQDSIPDVVRADIQPVVEIDKPKSNIVKTATRATSGSTSLYQTPTDRDFYLTGGVLSMSKNVTCDVASGEIASILIVIDGVSTKFLIIAGQTLTAERADQSMDMTFPIKIDRNTSISLSGGAFTAGALVRTATITGYIDVQGGV